MSVRVSLQDIVNEMAEISDRHSAFLDRRTGELLTLNDRYFLILDDDEVSAELLEKEEEARVQALMEEGYREMAEENLLRAEVMFPVSSEMVRESTRWPEHGEG